MSAALALAMVAAATVPVLDATRKEGVFARPEYFLLVTLYLYATFGYVSHLYLPAEAFRFMIPVPESAEHLSFLYSLLAIWGVYLGGELYGTRKLRFAPAKKEMLVGVALIGCLLALAFNAYYFNAYGLSAGTFDRVTYIDEFKKGGGFGVPYMILLSASLSLLALHERRPYSWSVLAAFALLHLPVGDRRVVLTVLIVVVVAKLLRGKIFGRTTVLTALVAILVVGVVVGGARAGQLSAILNLDGERIFRALSEFARPFVTSLYYVDSGYSPLFGRSFLEALVNVVPGSVLPFDKFVSLGQQFREIVATLGIYPGRVPGYGFSPVTEALLNFGPIGVPVFFFLFGVLVRRLSVRAVGGIFAFSVPVLCSSMFSFGRSTFSDVFVTFFWVVAFGLILQLASDMAVKAVRNERSVRGGAGVERGGEHSPLRGERAGAEGVGR